MFTKSDIESLRANGTTDREILQMTARVIPSASKALRDIDADKATPDITKASIMKQMIDRNAKQSGPSMLPYVSALTVNSATKKSDALQASYEKDSKEQKEKQFNPFAQGQTTFAQRLGAAIPKEGSILDYAAAPGDAAAGAIVKGLGAVTGMDVSKNEDVQQLPENLRQSADVARVAVPVAAGIATAGASIPAMAGISAVAGAGSSLLASGLEELGGEDQSLGGAVGEAIFTGGVNSLIDVATMGLLKLAKPIAKGVQLENAAKQIAQSKKAKDVAAVTKAVKEIPLDGIQTYDDLAKAFESRITSLSAAQDEVLSSVQKSVPLNKFTVVTKAGKQSVTTNPVSTAIDGLIELYTKNGDAQALANAKNLREIAKNGLTPKQVNDLAREFGKGYRAFSDATGNPITSINAQMYENVRKGVKQAARGLMPNDATKAMDDAMTDIFTAKRLASKMDEAVRGLSSRLEERGILSKIASKIGGAVDLSLGRTPSSLFTSLFLRGNVGQKQLNSAQIQALLPKNIKLIHELSGSMNTMPESTIIQKVLHLIGKSGTAQKAVVGEAVNLANSQ